MNQIQMKTPGHLDMVGLLGLTDASSAQGTDALTYLTPEALLAYVETQLRSLDGDIRKRLDGQRDLIARKKLLGDVEAALAKGPGAKEEICAAYERAIVSLPPGDPLRTKLEGMIEGMIEGKALAPQAGVVAGVVDAAEPRKGFGLCGPDDDKLGLFKAGSEKQKEYLSDQECKAMETTIKNELADLNAAAEITMIEVQSLMSQRTNAVQLGTGILQKINMSLDAIIKNM